MISWTVASHDPVRSFSGHGYSSSAPEGPFPGSRVRPRQVDYVERTFPSDYITATRPVSEPHKHLRPHCTVLLLQRARDRPIFSTRVPSTCLRSPGLRRLLSVSRSGASRGRRGGSVSTISMSTRRTPTCRSRTTTGRRSPRRTSASWARSSWSPSSPRATNCTSLAVRLEHMVSDYCECTLRQRPRV